MAGIHTFTGRYLRIQTPKTIDGIRIKYDEQRRPLFKTTYAPLKAKRDIMRANSKRPEHLKHIIDEVEGEIPIVKRF